MTNDSELTMIWRQLTQVNQQLNRTSGAEHHRLLSLYEMLRLEYRSLTSRFYY